MDTAPDTLRAAGRVARNAAVVSVFGTIFIGILPTIAVGIEWWANFVIVMCQ